MDRCFYTGCLRSASCSLRYDSGYKIQQLERHLATIAWDNSASVRITAASLSATLRTLVKGLLSPYRQDALHISYFLNGGL